MARKLIVELIGDDRSLQKALGRANKSAGGFGSTLGRVATIATGIVAGGAVIELGKQFAESAIRAQEETGKLNRAIELQGKSVAALTPWINKTTAANRKLGFTNSDTRDALLKLITAGDSAKKANKDLALAMDLARVKDISLSDATQTLIRAHVGNMRALKALGISIPPVTDAMAALTKKHKELKTPITESERAVAKAADQQATYELVARRLTQAIGGQAQEFSRSAAGGLAQFHAQIGNLEEGIGALMVKALGPYLARANQWLGNSKNQQLVLAKVTGAVKAVTVAVQTVIPYVRTAAQVADRAAQAFGGWKNTLKLLLGLAVASKVYGIAKSFTGGGGLIPSVLGANRALVGKAGLLGSLTRLKNLGVITVGIDLAFNPPSWAKRYSGAQGWANLFHDITHGFPQATKPHKTTEPTPFAPEKKMAAGGIVRRPTVALLGEAGPEAVVPLGKGGGTIHVHVDLDGREIANVLVPQLQRRGRRTVTQRGGVYGGTRLAMG